MGRGRGRIAKREARQLAAFRVFACLVAVLTLFGLARVSLSARVAQASIDACDLREAIKGERVVTDGLEIDRGVLSTPGRLANIASSSMQMCEPSELAYLELAGAGEASGDVGTPLVTPAQLEEEGFTMRRLVATVMDMAAGEAEVLLVGDVALASSR